MQIIPILVVDDKQAAIDFYRHVFRAEVGQTLVETTQLFIQGQSIGIRQATESHEKTQERIVLLAETAAPDVLEQNAIKHGAEVISPVDDDESGLRLGRISDPFGIQWILSTAFPR